MERQKRIALQFYFFFIIKGCDRDILVLYMAMTRIPTFLMTHQGGVIWYIGKKPLITQNQASGRYGDLRRRNYKRRKTSFIQRSKATRIEATSQFSAVTGYKLKKKKKKRRVLLLFLAISLAIIIM
ncbi:hypothetical protein BDE02_04G052000 [Populus trichocarpa]|nr:hypothetical protein BDE02_04G052000 [Populus trichocarpa]